MYRVGETPTERAKREQEELDRHKAEFFANGGKIKEVPPGVSGLRPEPPLKRFDGIKSL